jgi:hypothetical protein
MPREPVARSLATPNTLLWNFHDAIKWQIRLAKHAIDAEQKKHIAIICIILSVALVEAFFNVFFRLLIEEPKFSHLRDQVLKELEESSLDFKIKEWPRRFLGVGIDLGKGVGQAFINLKDTRNWLMHFTTTHETFTQETITFQGVSDISRYDQLDVKDSIDALLTSEQVILEVLKLRGIQNDQLERELDYWLGASYKFHIH